MRIEIADSDYKYEGLKDLWVRVFGDEPGFVDYVYEVFGDDITGYVIMDDSRKVVSALTCYRSGDLSGRPVYVSYAVCTDPEYRGLGLAGRLTGYVRDIVTSPRGSNVTAEDAPDAEGFGGISLVSPAEEDLIRFYRAHGYEETCFAREITTDPDEEELILSEDDDFEAVTPAFSVVPADVSMYNMYREAFLADSGHVAMSPAMLELVRSSGPEGGGLWLIGGGDAVAAVIGEGDDLMIAELIVNPRLRDFSEEIDGEIACRLAEHFGFERLKYRVPDDGASPDAYVQSMVSGDYGTGKFYFGFPID